MANKKPQKPTAYTTADRSSIAIYGQDETLDSEAFNLDSVASKIAAKTISRYSSKSGEGPVDYFTRVDINELYSKKPENGNADIKTVLENNNGRISDLLNEDQNRLIRYANYQTIYEHIPECAQTLDLYKDSIMSPDDYTKMIFSVSYNDSNDLSAVQLVTERTKDLISRYSIEDKADEILEDSLLYGDCFVAILSLDKELSRMIDSPVFNKLNESDDIFNDNVDASKILKESDIFIKVNKKDKNSERYSKLLIETANDLYGTDEKLFESVGAAEKKILEEINKNIEIVSKQELLHERFDMEKDKKMNSSIEDYTTAYDSSVDIPLDLIYHKHEKNKKKPVDTKPLGISGSSIRILDPSKVVALEVDDSCFGYFYIESDTSDIDAAASYLGPKTNVLNSTTATNITQAQTSTSNSYTQRSSTAAANRLNVSDQKLEFISNIFLKAISKKINKKFIRRNKQFKKYIYDLVKNEYIIKKKIRITYFEPNEMVHFKADAVYKKIVFSAKLYLAVLTNIVLINLGRGNDKRVFYVATGLDANYQQAVSSFIQHIKTREYRSNSLNGDINTVLRDTPGRFSDYVIPTVNGERPVEIETIAGQETAIRNDFTDYLKNSMIIGMGVPRSLLDSLAETEFAKTLTMVNANFVRTVIRYQKKLTPAFSKFMQILYHNEYEYNHTSEENNNALIDLNKIKINFPSPASLNTTNMADAINTADSNAEFISQQLCPPGKNMEHEELRLALKSKVAQDLLPIVDWDKYQEMLKKLDDSVETKSKIENMNNNEDENNNGY